MCAHLGADHRAFQFGVVGVLDQQRHARFAQRRQAARVQDLGAGGGDFLRLLVVQPLQQARARYLARVGGKHAGHVGPGFHPRRLQQGTEVRRGSIRTAAAEQHGAALRVAGDETLGDQHLAQRGQPRVQGRIGLRLDHRRQQPGTLVLVRQRHRRQAFARIQPLRGQTAVAEEGGAQRAGHQLALRLHLRLPGQLAARRGAVLGQPHQFAQPLAEGVRQSQLHVLQQVVVALCDRAGRRPALVFPTLAAQLFQRVGDAGQRGNHHQHARAFGTAAGDQFADVLPAGKRGDTGAAELHHDPGSVRRQGRGSWRGHGCSLWAAGYPASVALRHPNCKWFFGINHLDV